jgi:hypothetical protein
MADDRSAQATVEVSVDPGTAFRVFTEEIDSWWVPGPINFFDAGRATGMAVEPAVGGRVLELYGDQPPLVIAQVTTWEPGVRVVYRGVVDDTETVVTFTPVAGGTRVHVRQHALPGGTRAFLFWPNVIDWFASHTTASQPGASHTQETPR